jgi:hypothetical protein
MTRSALDRLLELRRRREEKALEALALRQGAHRRARHQAEEAESAASQHAASSKDREHALMASLLGKDISQAALRRLQDNLDTMAIEQHELKASAEAARKELAERGKELQKAGKLYRDRRTDAEKLKELRDQEKAKTARHQLVIGETIEEDQTGLAAPRSRIL